MMWPNYNIMFLKKKQPKQKKHNVVYNNAVTKVQYEWDIEHTAAIPYFARVSYKVSIAGTWVADVLKMWGARSSAATITLTYFSWNILLSAPGGINLSMKGCGQTRSSSWLLMSWLLTTPGASVTKAWLWLADVLASANHSQAFC